MDLEHIQRKIHEIRGVKIILDFDLAFMYEVEPLFSLKNLFYRNKKPTLALGRRLPIRKKLLRKI